MRITLLTYASLLSYLTRGSSPKIDEARDLALNIKFDKYIFEPPVLASDWFAESIKQNIDRLPFADFFGKRTVLVPVPSSSLMKDDSLWTPNQIAKALVKKGIGRVALPCLVRKTAVRKSAWSPPSQRPKVKEHIASMVVQGVISDPQPEELVLIDDIVTRGATLLASANLLQDALPKAKIRAFAAVRAIGNPAEFESLSSPVVGSIQYRPKTDDTLRRP